MNYHRVTYKDCLSVATKDERYKLTQITSMDLLADLAGRWCKRNGYRLGGYLGGKDWAWDATKI